MLEHPNVNHDSKLFLGDGLLGLSQFHIKSTSFIDKSHFAMREQMFYTSIVDSKNQLTICITFSIFMEYKL